MNATPGRAGSRKSLGLRDVTLFIVTAGTNF